MDISPQEVKASEMEDKLKETESGNISTEKTTVTVTTGEEFGYIQRKEFTSEIYKIEVRNLGYFGIGEFKKLLKNKLKLDMAKLKSPQRKEFAYVCFRSQEDQEKALKLLNGYKWKGKVLVATVAKASADPLQRKRKEGGLVEDEPSNNNKKKQRTSADATCPLAHLSYEDQLKKKYYEMEELIKKFTQDLKKINKEAKHALKDFKYEGALASPQIDGYRNKNEFTVGKNSSGDIVVGFRLGSYADGSVEVAEIDALPHIPKAAKWAAKTFQEFVKQSKFKPFNPEGNTGHFRQIMVRTSKLTNELMLVPGIYTSNMSDEELQQVKKDLIDYYEKLSLKEAEEETEFKCTSLYYQDVKHREVGQMVSPVEHLSGTSHIKDTIHDLEFRISPLAFFQINTASANVLYKNAIELAAPKRETTVLDICCGTGTIALAFAKHCKQVLGVDIIPDAIVDAAYNAEKNGITNCKFYAGNADDYIQSMVKEVVYGTAPGEPLDLVAVVDPPRAGLHNRSILAIRAATAIKRLVYISCHPEKAQKNWIELGRPESKQYKGEPFYPVTAVAVDMFPHTNHTELIVLFERKAAKENNTKASADDKNDNNTTIDQLDQKPKECLGETLEESDKVEEEGKV